MRFPAPSQLKTQKSKVKITVQKSKLRRTFKFLLVLLTSTFLLLTFTHPIQAQQSSTQAPSVQTNPYLNTNTTPDVPQNLNTWTQNIMINLLSAGVCQLAGVNPVTPDKRCLGVDPATGKIGFVAPPSYSSSEVRQLTDESRSNNATIEQYNNASSRQARTITTSGQPQAGGAIGVVGHLIAATFTHPPASTGEYLAYMGGKFGIVEPAYAQGGTGFAGLQPLVRIWVAFRNITYLVFVIVFVIIGLMIMLRVKIDPRTVMTVQNSIPRVIIGLVLVTFSFALAGFLIDMMYVIIFLFIGFFEGMGIPEITDAIAKVRESYQTQNVIAVFNEMAGVGAVAKDVAGAFKDSLTVALGGGLPVGPSPTAGAIGGVLGGIAGKIALGALFTNIVGAVVGATLGIITGFGILELTTGITGQEVIGVGAGILAFLVILIALLWALFRLLIQLVQAYIWILIDIVFAPMWIIGGMFPGSPVSFSAWLRDIISHLSAFPVTIFMFLLGKAFIEGFGRAAATGSAFTPPLIGAQSVDAIKAFIGMGIIFLTPQVLNIVKDAFKAPVFKYGAAVGQAIGVGTGAPGGVFGGGSRFGSALFGISQLPGASAVLERFGYKPRGVPQ